MSLIPFRKGNLWGFADTGRNVVLKPVFNEADCFVAGFAVVKKGAKYGYIDKIGNVVIPFRFYSAKAFRYGYFDNSETHMVAGKMVHNQDTVLFAGATLKPGGVEICINTKGQYMSRCPAINENSDADNVQLVGTNKKDYGQLNKSDLYDNLVDDYKVTGDEHNYYIGVKNNLYGVINNVFEVIVPFEYASISCIRIGESRYLLAVKNNNHGVFTGNGSVSVPLENNDLSYIKTKDGSDYLIISRDGKNGVRDLNNREIIETIYTDIVYDSEGAFIVTGSDNLKGVYFPGKKMIGPKYLDVKMISGGRFIRVTTKNERTGYVNDQGTEFFED